MTNVKKIDFGNVKLGQNATATVAYTGDVALTDHMVKVPCSCTGWNYNPSTKELTFNVTFKYTGEWSTTISLLTTPIQYIQLNATVS